MNHHSIRSSSNPDDPRPWADLELADGSLDVTVRELNGLVAFRQRNGLGADAPPGWSRRPDPTQHSFARSSDTGPSPIAPATVDRGAWDGSLVYEPGDLVSHNGAWVAVDPTVTGDEPGVSAKWGRARPQVRDEIHVLAVTLDGELEFVPQSQQRPVYFAHLTWWDPATGEWTVLEFVEA